MKALLVCVMLFWLLFAGCSGTGFDKRATIMPDSVTVSFGQSRYREEDSAYRGAEISATWNLK